MVWSFPPKFFWYFSIKSCIVTPVREYEAGCSRRTSRCFPAIDCAPVLIFKARLGSPARVDALGMSPVYQAERDRSA